MMTPTIGKGEMQPATSEQYVEDPSLPRMKENPIQAPLGRKRIQLMAESPKPDTGKSRRMDKFRGGKDSELRRASSSKPRPDQLPARRSAVKQSEESYLRMRVRLDGGAMRVVDIRQVEGPLAAATTIRGNFAAELKLADERLRLEILPDLGTRRSYIDPENMMGRQGVHGNAPLTRVEFFVRVATPLISLSALPKILLVLYEVKDAEAARRLSISALEDPEFKRSLREVARMEGVDVAKMPERARSRIRQMLAK